MLLVTRLLLAPRGTDVSWRVVHVEPGVVWIRVRGSTSWPEPVEADQLLAQIGDRSVAVLYEQPRHVAEPTDAARRLHDERFEMLRPLIRHDVAPLLVTARRGRLINERVAELLAQGKSTSYQSIGNMLRRWWDRGMTYHALALDYDLCGARGRPRPNATGNVGRPRRDGSRAAAADDVVRQKLQMAADRYLNKDLTLRNAWEWLCTTHFCDVVTDGAGREELRVREDRPSLRQLQHFVLFRYTRAVRRRLKSGMRAYLLSQRELTSRADHDVQAPGDRYEIDATIADLYLVSKLDPLRIIGRPVVYSVIDAYSHAVVGFYVGIEGPSWAGAMKALISMVTPKVELCARWGVHIEEHQWPCHLAPKAIMADRGELMSHRLGANIVRNLNIDIQNVAPYRGDLKAIVERTHRTLPTIWKPFAPGYVRPDYGERGANDYRLKAALTLDEFTEMMILSILIYNQEPGKKRRGTPGMVSEGLVPSPVDFWDWGVRNCAPRLHALSVDEVALEVLPTGRAAVTAHGILFEDGRYDCALARQGEWYEAARGGPQRLVDVSYDPNDLGELYLRTGVGPQVVEKLRPMDVDAHRIGQSLYDVVMLREEGARNVRTGEAGRLSKTLTYKKRMDEISAGAERRRQAALSQRPTSDRARIGGIRENRAEERALRRADETIRIGAPDAVAPPAPAPEPMDRRSRKLALISRTVHGKDPS